MKQELQVQIEMDKRSMELAIRSIVLTPEAFAVGTVRRRRTSTTMRLIVSELARVDGIPSGNRMPALAGWAVLTIARSGQPHLSAMPALVEATRSQLVVCFLLDADDPRQLGVCVWDRGTLVRPEQVRIVGSGGLRLNSPAPTSADVSDAVPTDFQRLRNSRIDGILPTSLRRFLRESHVAVTGAGGGGSSLVRQLMQFQPLSLTCIDPDTVGAENLNALSHAAVTDAQRGARKVEVLGTAWEANQPDVLFRGLPWSVQAGQTARYLENKQIDVWFSFCDADCGRIASGILARRHFAVHVDIGTRILMEGDDRRMRADIRLFEPGAGRGCALCVPEMEPARREAALYELNAPEGALHRGAETAWDDPVRGRAGTWPGLNDGICMLAVNLWHEWLAGKRPTSHWLRVDWLFGEEMEITRFDVEGAEDCAVCGQ